MKQKKRGKRKFRKFFWWRFLLSLNISGVFLAVLIYPYIKADMLDEVDANPAGTNDSVIEKDLSRYDRIESALNELTRSFSYTGVECATMLFQPETGKYYFNEPCASISIWQNGIEKCCWLHDYDMLERLTDAIGGNMNFFWNYPIIYSVYIKDDMFLPGEVFERSRLPFCFPGTEFEEGKQQHGKWIDLSPENTEGWTKICSDYSKDELCVYHAQHPIYSYRNADFEQKSRADSRQHLGYLQIYGTVYEPRAIAFKNTIKTKYPERFQELQIVKNKRMESVEHGTLSLEILEAYNVNNRQELIEEKRDYYMQRMRDLPMEIYKSELSDYYHLEKVLHIRNHSAWMDDVPVLFRDQEWYVFHFRYLDPYFTFKRYVCCGMPYIFGCWVLPSLLIALFWSLTAYLIYSKHYDIEAYRVNLTNALAHDLKTPLAVIYGHAENLRAHTHPESADDYVDTIMENVTHIDDMIAGVLGLAQLESRTAPEQKEKVDLTALLHDAFLRSESLMEQRGLTLQESSTLKIKGNAEMLRQLAANLAANAVQHASDGGTITVTAEKRTLRISNPYTGELNTKTICEPFQRGDRARGSQSGSGLGLSIVQQIAVLHSIKLRITAKDGTFTVALKPKKRF